MIFDSANNNRSIVASRAAEIIMEEGVTDYLFAKRKAAKFLGLLTNDNLPSNHEIDNALKAYRNIFQEQVDSETIVKIKKEYIKPFLNYCIQKNITYHFIRKKNIKTKKKLKKLKN